ncbi:hypothetical protein D3C71_2028790 [compost metagenome]
MILKRRSRYKIYGGATPAFLYELGLQQPDLPLQLLPAIRSLHLTSLCRIHFIQFHHQPVPLFLQGTDITLCTAVSRNGLYGANA